MLVSVTFPSSHDTPATSPLTKVLALDWCRFERCHTVMATNLCTIMHSSESYTEIMQLTV